MRGGCRPVAAASLLRLRRCAAPVGGVSADLTAVQTFGVVGGPTAVATSASASSVVTATSRHFSGGVQQQRPPRRPLPTRSTAASTTPMTTEVAHAHSGAAAVSAQVGADSSADGSQQLQFVGHSAAGHAARCRFVALVDRLVWADAFGANSNSNSGITDEAAESPAAPPSPSSSANSSGGGVASSSAVEPCPTLDELVAAFSEGSAELSDVIASSSLDVSLSKLSPTSASSSVASTAASAGRYPTLCAANASFVTALEAREAIVAFVEATARALQSHSMHRLIEERAAVTPPMAPPMAADVAPNTTHYAEATSSSDPPAPPAVTTATAAASAPLIDGSPPERIIPSMRRVAIAAAAELLPHAAEAHDSVDEAVALLTCAAAVLTLAPPMAERAAMRRLLVPATVVCRRLMGPDMATLMLCLARVYDAAPANSSSSPSSSSMFLSYSSLADLKTLELELFRRFDATFAKYTPPPMRGGGGSPRYSSSSMSGGSPRDGPLSAEQREAHRRQFIAARQRALLTLTDVAEIATAFAIHRFAGSADMAFAPAATLATCGGASGAGAAASSTGPASALTKRPISTSKAPPTPAALRSASSSATAAHSADTSRLWARIVQYTIDFVAHDLRLSAEARAAAAAAEREALSVLMGDGDGDESSSMATAAAEEEEGSSAKPEQVSALSSSSDKEKKYDEEGDDMIDTTFTRADLQSICFALDRVGCRSGYDRLMGFLVMRGVVRQWIDPPSASFGHSGPLQGEGGALPQ